MVSAPARGSRDARCNTRIMPVADFAKNWKLLRMSKSAAEKHKELQVTPQVMMVLEVS